MALSRVLPLLGIATPSTTDRAATSAVRSVVASPAPAGVQPPPRESAATVTVADAHTLDAVYRAHFILQTAASQLTMDVRRAGTVLDPAPSIVTRPDIEDTGTAFWAETVGSLATRGNAFWLRRAGSDGSTIALKVINPWEVAPWRNKRDELIYTYRGRDYRPGRGDGIAHLKLLRLPGELLGLGPIQACARGLAGQLNVAGYGDEWFTAGDIPSGVLSTDAPLTPDQAAAWKAQWTATVRAGETAVLGAGLNYKALMLSPAEVQWLESQKFGTTGVARMFGIPPRLMLAAVDGSSMTYTNMIQEDLSFNRYTLMRYLREIEAAMTDILPRGQDARFNVDAFLRPDTKTRYEAHKIGLDAGFLSVPEVRAIEGLPTLAPAPGPAVDPAALTPDPASTGA